jgi:MFS family permease
MAMRRSLGADRPHRTARPARPVLVVAVLALCGNVTALQQTVVLPLVPELPRLLGASADGASWVVTATLISGALATPVVSRLADMLGKRLMVMLCLILMVTGSALGALSDSLSLVIAARALQGVGMALIPVGIAILHEQLPPDRVPLGVALMSATLAIGGRRVLRWPVWRCSSSTGRRCSGSQVVLVSSSSLPFLWSCPSPACAPVARSISSVPCSCPV